mgnify:CR=1 FL=1
MAIPLNLAAILRIEPQRQRLQYVRGACDISVNTVVVYRGIYAFTRPLPRASWIAAAEVVHCVVQNRFHNELGSWNVCGDVLTCSDVVVQGGRPISSVLVCSLRRAARPYLASSQETPIPSQISRKVSGLSILEHFL